MVWRPDWTDEDDEIAAMYPRDDHEADAHLIAHGPTDLTALLAEVARLHTNRVTLVKALSAVVAHVDAIIDHDEWQGATDAIEDARALLAKEPQS
jgi:hypothetical protein